MPASNISRVETRLAGDEVASLLGGHFVQIYLDVDNRYVDCAHFLLPVFDWESFHARFEACGRKVRELSLEDENIAAIVFATAARISSHPAIIGAGGSSDVVRHGYARKDVCSALRIRAQQLCDQRGAWRTPSEGNAVTMLLMRQMMCNGDLQQSEGRSYASMSLEHVRQLYRHNPNRLQDAGGLDGLAWCSIILDALASVEGGQQPLASDLDCILLMGSFRPYLSTASDLRDSLLAPFPDYWRPWLGSWHYVVVLARAVAVGIASPTAQTHELDLDLVSSVWSDLDDVYEWARRATRTRADVDIAKAVFMEVFTNSTWTSALAVDFALHDHLTSRMADWASNLQVYRRLPSDDELPVLASLLAFSLRRIEERISTYVASTINNRGIDLLVVGTGTFFSLSRLRSFAETFLAAPVELAGSHEAKLSLLNFFLTTLLNAARSWDGLEDILAAFRDERVRLENQIAAKAKARR